MGLEFNASPSFEGCRVIRNLFNYLVQSCIGCLFLFIKCVGWLSHLIFCDLDSRCVLHLIKAVHNLSAFNRWWCPSWRHVWCSISCLVQKLVVLGLHHCCVMNASNSEGCYSYDAPHTSYIFFEIICSCSVDVVKSFAVLFIWACKSRFRFRVISWSLVTAWNSVPVNSPSQSYEIWVGQGYINSRCGSFL